MKQIVILIVVLALHLPFVMANPKISFFEEFPDENITFEIKLINFNTTVYVAAHNITEFQKYEKELKTKNKHIKEVIYWPILSRKEGYWISPFSKREALSRIFQELKRKKIPVMLDLELPTSRSPWLYFTELGNFRGNKKLISNFIQNYSGEIYTAEYFPKGRWGDRKLQALGLHYPHPKIKVIKMLYHSLHPSFSDKYITQQLRRGQEQWGNNFMVGFGTIATGISGKKKILAPRQLENDVRIVKEVGIKEVVIFRLGGWNEEYSEIFNETRNSLR